jgi:hypothetical protein
MIPAGVRTQPLSGEKSLISLMALAGMAIVLQVCHENMWYHCCPVHPLEEIVSSPQVHASHPSGLIGVREAAFQQLPRAAELSWLGFTLTELRACIFLRCSQIIQNFPNTFD